MINDIVPSYLSFQDLSMRGSSPYAKIELAFRIAVLCREAFNTSFIFLRCISRQLFENNVKIFYVVKSAKRSDLFIGKAAAVQELLGAFNSFGIRIRGRRAGVRLVKQLVKIGAADMRLLDRKSVV